MTNELCSSHQNKDEKYDITTEGETTKQKHLFYGAIIKQVIK